MTAIRGEDCLHLCWRLPLLLGGQMAATCGGGAGVWQCASLSGCYAAQSCPFGVVLADVCRKLWFLPYFLETWFYELLEP